MSRYIDIETIKPRQYENSEDEIISFEEFIHLVEEKQKINNPDDFVYARNVNGFRFSDEEFS